MARVLARAFHDDPVAEWLIPDAAVRVQRQAGMFAAMIRHHHLAGGGVEMATESGTPGAVALWDPPNRWKASRGGELRSIPAMIWALRSRVAAGRELSDLMAGTHPASPHWYLATIGSDPSTRGRGLGKALLASRLDRCDAEHCPAYLESSKAENVPYYQRFGFEVTGEIVVPRGGPTLWRMWREPRP